MKEPITKEGHMSDSSLAVRLLRLFAWLCFVGGIILLIDDLVPRARVYALPYSLFGMLVFLMIGLILALGLAAFVVSVELRKRGW
ncbi:MAG TPA: hypothetical protein VKZ50_13900 [bacterium]|nr:hypothetical protein [bacterium]